MNEVSIDMENNEHGMHHYSGKNDDNEENEDSQETFTNKNENEPNTH